MPDLCDISSECAEKEFKAHISSIQSQLHKTHYIENSDGNRYCIDCESIIPKKRLECMPNAVRCMKCQQIYEDGLQ